MSITNRRKKKFYKKGLDELATEGYKMAKIEQQKGGK